MLVLIDWSSFQEPTQEYTGRKLDVSGRGVLILGVALHFGAIDTYGASCYEIFFLSEFLNMLKMYVVATLKQPT